METKYFPVKSYCKLLSGVNIFPSLMVKISTLNPSQVLGGSIGEDPNHSPDVKGMNPCELVPHF